MLKTLLKIQNMQEAVNSFDKITNPNTAHSVEGITLDKECQVVITVINSEISRLTEVEKHFVEEQHKIQPHEGGTRLSSDQFKAKGDIISEMLQVKGMLESLKRLNELLLVVVDAVKKKTQDDHVKRTVMKNFSDELGKAQSASLELYRGSQKYSYINVLQEVTPILGRIEQVWMSN